MVMRRGGMQFYNPERDASLAHRHSRPVGKVNTAAVLTMCGDRLLGVADEAVGYVERDTSGDGPLEEYQRKFELMCLEKDEDGEEGSEDGEVAWFPGTVGELMWKEILDFMEADDVDLTHHPVVAEHWRLFVPTDDIVLYLFSHYGAFIRSATLDLQKIWFCVAEALAGALAALISLDHKLAFDQLLDIFGLDHLGRKNRFEVDYVLVSVLNHFRTVFRVFLAGDSTQSLAGLYPSAVWLERETWDMLGLFFYNHPDLRRILTDYGFEGYPLRKDFPLTGYREVRYDEFKKKIVGESLKLAQEYRYFDFLTPWKPEPVTVTWNVSEYEHINEYWKYFEAEPKEEEESLSS